MAISLLFTQLDYKLRSCQYLRVIFDKWRSEIHNIKERADKNFDLCPMVESNYEVN